MLSFRYWYHQKILIKRYLLSYLSACNICCQIGTTESRWHKILSKNECIIKVHHFEHLVADHSNYLRSRDKLTSRSYQKWVYYSHLVCMLSYHKTTITCTQILVQFLNWKFFPLLPFHTYDIEFITSIV